MARGKTSAQDRAASSAIVTTRHMPIRICLDADIPALRVSCPGPYARRLCRDAARAVGRRRGDARRHALLADGDAALERGDLPAAATAYRRCRRGVGRRKRRRAGDARRVRQLPAAAKRRAAADRWLALNPTSEQAHRYAGLVALQLHRLDAAEQPFRRAARHRLHQPGRRVSRAVAGDRRRRHRPPT